MRVNLNTTSPYQINKNSNPAFKATFIEPAETFYNLVKRREKLEKAIKPLKNKVSGFMDDTVELVLRATSKDNQRFGNVEMLVRRADKTTGEVINGPKIQTKIESGDLAADIADTFENAWNIIVKRSRLPEYSKFIN